LKVRYSPILAGAFLALGVVSLVLGLWLLALGNFAPGLVIGAMLILLGTLYLVRPYFHVEPTSITVPALLGPKQRVVNYETLLLDGSRLVAISPDGVRTKVPVFRWSSHPADWKALVATRL
jgi:hypothetical protein